MSKRTLPGSCRVARAWVNVASRNASTCSGMTSILTHTTYTPTSYPTAGARVKASTQTGPVSSRTRKERDHGSPRSFPGGRPVSQAGRWAIWITVSRSWSDADSIRAVLGRFPAGSLVLHGDDLGADRLADVVARGLQMPTAKVPYIEWMGPRGGVAR